MHQPESPRGSYGTFPTLVTRTANPPAHLPEPDDHPRRDRHCRVARVRGRRPGAEPGGSHRAQDDATLVTQIQFFHARSDGPYGAPRIWKDLREEAARCVAPKRVARLMQQPGLVGVHRRRSTRTTVRAADGTPSADLVQWDFTAAAPSQLWVADITYVPTWSGFLFLATVLDVFSRRIVGWAMETSLKPTWCSPRCRWRRRSAGPA